ncbi:ABC transporter permease subunit [Kallotenue papyrolyticum]|uniref:ABC transporter permease subunit n=1 Tax=Kallotenue papyrolyticum TaxID=1325125 RepID=UPI000478625A|nr:ABC transporter permease subunit [Kallotenue papyrolyticum]
MVAREVRLLMRKEWRQLRRSRGALLSALFFPTLFLLIIPGGQMLALASGADAAMRSNLPAGVPLPPGLAAMGNDPRALLRMLLLPLFMLLSGLIVPAMTATYTLIAERENRTLELLVALPVRVTQILLAKLLVILLLSGGITLPLFAIDAALLLWLKLATPGLVLVFLLLLIAALAYSTASALLISLLAKDFRTANNLTGALISPLILLSLGVLLGVPGTWSIGLLVLLYALAALGAALIALRVITFERLLR